MQRMNLGELQAEILRLKAELAELKSGRGIRSRRMFDRLVSGRNALLALLAVAAIFGTVSYADQISTPHTFTNGEVADANHVNADFTTLVNESNDQDNRITDLEDLHHHELLGLADDDHLQYLLQNGSEPVTGSLTIDQDLLVGVNTTMSGALSVSGNANLGDATNDTTTINDLLKLTGRASAPSCVLGTVYYDSTTTGIPESGGVLCVCVRTLGVNTWAPLGPGVCS